MVGVTEAWRTAALGRLRNPALDSHHIGLLLLKLTVLHKCSCHGLTRQRRLQ